MYIDIHSHYKKTTKNQIIISNLSTIDSIEEKENLWYSVGVHPWESKEWNIKTYNLLKERALNKRIIAIGEIGLDRIFNVSFNVQLSVFECQLDIAQTIKKPVIIHSVKAHSDVLALIKRYQRVNFYILHNFGANLQVAKQYLKRNTFFSFGKLLFNGHRKTVETFKWLPLDSIFFETDMNNYQLKEMYTLGAELKGISVENLATQIKNNFITCFGNDRKFGLGGKD